MTDRNDLRDQFAREYEERRAAEDARYRETMRRQLHAASYPFAAAFALITAGFLIQSGLAASLLAGGALMLIAALVCFAMF